MAITKLKKGYEAIKYVFTKALTKKGVKGIATIPGKAYDMRMKELVDEMATKMRNLGYDVNEVTEKEVRGLLDSSEALEKQKLKNVHDKFFDKSGKMKKEGEDIVKEGLAGLEKYTDKRGRTWEFKPKVEGKPFDLFPGANLKAVPKVTVDEHITFIKSKDPIESMKEANKIIGRKNPSYKGRYKNLTDDEAQKILKDTDDHIFERDIQYDEFGDPIKPEPEDFQSGGLAYMLGEPNTRIEALQHAGVIADPRGLYTDPSIYSKGESEIPQNYYEGGGVGRGPWTKGLAPGITEQPPQSETPVHHAQGLSDPTKIARGLPSLAPRTMDPQYMQQQRMQQMMAGMGQQRGIPGQGPRPMANAGGRIGFADGTQEDFKQFMKEREQMHREGGKQDILRDWERYKLYKKYGKGAVQEAAEGGIMRMGFKKGGDWTRRKFLQFIGGAAALPIVGKYFKAAKLAKPAAAVTETIIKSNAPGMPIWFPKLVQRVLKEGEDISKGAATAERQTVHSIKLPESGTPVQVTRDLVTDDIIVDIGVGKHGWGSGRHGQPAQLVLKKGEWIEPTKTKKGIKTKDEFYVDEAEFTGGHPENVKFEESAIEKYGDHASDFTEVEKYAVGKNIDKKIVGKKAQSDAWAEGRAESAADEVDFASGGLAYLLGE